MRRRKLGVSSNRFKQRTFCVTMAGLLLASAMLFPVTQAPAGQVDTLPVARLDTLEVTVSRRRERLARLPMAAAVVTRATIRDGQPTLGLDESLTTVPGVYVANRWNFSLDQRLSIRGFGSRANFGLRGVKVLQDGVPQTLPDGQSQLTNVEFASLERVEVLRGAASALYGNASGGALVLETARPGPEPEALRVRAEAGSFGSRKWLGEVTGRRGAVAAGLTLSRFTTDGVRQRSAAEIRQLNGVVLWTASPGTEMALRFALGDTPRAENPGALTAAELAANRDSAASGNLLRGADKQVQQQQVSIRATHLLQGGAALGVTVFGLWRDLENPLATPPPGPFSPTAGTWNSIDRSVGGARIETTLPVSERLTLTAGVDAQRMADERENRRSEEGERTDVVLADQREVISEIGPFVQAHWATRRVTVEAGTRYDRIRFAIQDRFFADGADNSGARTMQAVSGNLGASVQASQAVALYGRASTAFETPTSTELVNQADATVGFNSELDPQRAWSAEVGLRAQTGRATGTLSVFTIGIRDAIVQVREQSGRAFFANAGRTRNRGVEAGLSLALGSWSALRAAYTLADYTFTDYVVRTGTTADTLNGNRLAGVPRHFARVGLHFFPRAGLTASVDHQLATSLFADDANTITVEGWGAGVTAFRVTWTGTVGGSRIAPFLAVQNAFDRRYVGSVTINGTAGRVFEPAPGRNVWVGTEVRLARR